MSSLTKSTTLTRCLQALRLKIRTLIPVVLLSLLPWLLYSHTQSFEAVLDDQEYVLENPLLQDGKSFLYLLNLKTFANSHSTWAISPDLPLNLITRPVTYLTYFANRCLNGVETPGYRIVNISLHMLNGILLFTFLRVLLRHQGRQLLSVPLLVALLFAAHPLATESVTYIAQRFGTLTTLFCLSAMLCHIKSRTEQAQYTGVLVGMSVFFTFLAMLSKETGVTIPVLLLMMEIFWFRSAVLQAFKNVRWHLALLPLIPALIIATEWAQSGRLSLTKAMHITNGGPVMFDTFHYFMTQVCAWMSYLRLLFIPVGQSFDHHYPLVTSVMDLRFIASATTAMLMLISAGLFHLRRRDDASACLFVGMLWFFIGLAPSSSIIPLPDLFSEHRTYFASVGFFIGLAGLFQSLSTCVRSDTQRRFSAACGVGALIALSLTTLVRNEVLRTRESIWQDALAKGSQSPRVWKGLGISAHMAGRHEEAIRCFRNGIASNPADVESWMNLCTLQIKHGNPQSALADTSAALDAIGNLLPIVHLHALALVKVGRWQNAVDVWKQLLEIIPTHRDSNLCLAEVYVQIGQPQQAMRHFHAAEKTGPLNVEFLALKQQMQSQLASLP
jgi:protein O-mannosyl-transferase